MNTLFVVHPICGSTIFYMTILYVTAFYVFVWKYIAYDSRGIILYVLPAQSYVLY